MSEWPSISVDGPWVAFDFWAANLVMDDTNGQRDVFVHDRQLGSTARVSVGTSGVQQDGRHRDVALDQSDVRATAEKSSSSSPLILQVWHVSVAAMPLMLTCSVAPATGPGALTDPPPSTPVMKGFPTGAIGE